MIRIATISFIVAMTAIACGQAPSHSETAALNANGRGETEITTTDKALMAVFSTADSEKLYTGIDLEAETNRTPDAPRRWEKNYKTSDGRLWLYCSKADVQPAHHFCMMKLSVEPRAEGDMVVNRTEGEKLIARVMSVDLDAQRLFDALAGFGNDDKRDFSSVDGVVGISCWKKPSYHGPVTLCDVSVSRAK